MDGCMDRTDCLDSSDPTLVQLTEPPKAMMCVCATANCSMTMAVSAMTNTMILLPVPVSIFSVSSVRKTMHGGAQIIVSSIH